MHANLRSANRGILGKINDLLINRRRGASDMWTLKFSN